MKSNIALIGFMGTGKSYIGNLLAKKLNKKFVEMDKIIEQRAGKSIPAIFKDEGEIAFREKEIDTCKYIGTLDNVIIACGGGVILNKINIDYLKQNSFIVCLESSIDIIFSRIMKDGKEARPLLNKPNPKQIISALLKFRSYFYSAYPDVIINTDGLSEEIVEKIIKKFEDS